MDGYDCPNFEDRGVGDKDDDDEYVDFKRVIVSNRCHRLC